MQNANHIDARVLQTTLEHIRAIGDVEEPFYTVDLRSVAAKYKLITTLIPRVQPFYTMKCNPDVRVFELLTGLGCGVDCASQPEIAFALRHGVAPDQLIYANTIKQKSHLHFAKTHDVALMTFDNVDELVKVDSEYHDAKLVLRIQVDDSKSRHQLGAKFGAPLADIPLLLETAKQRRLNVVGVCFHVGVGVLDATAFSDAIQRAKTVFDMAEPFGFHFDLLNVGGGFAGDDLGPVTIQDAATAVNSALDEYFPESSGVRVISEPGRYFVSACATLNLNVIGRKTDPTLTARAKAEHEAHEHVPRYMYFVNDGVHGSFSAPYLFKLYDPIPIVMSGKAVESSADNANPVVPSSVWGPTCDGKDFITKETQLPVLEIGDWITFPHMGAYGFATGGTFNGFLLPGKIYVELDDEAATP
ncbi:Ornithine decarboxylase, partial [Globisporangium splendens]